MIDTRLGRAVAISTLALVIVAFLYAAISVLDYIMQSIPASIQVLVFVTVIWLLCVIMVYIVDWR